MKLIDGTALWYKVYQLAWSNQEKVKTLDVLDMISKAPIVGPTGLEHHGYWIPEYDEDGTCKCFHCSECDNNGRKKGHKEPSPYCPTCGAKMDKKGRF